MMFTNDKPPYYVFAQFLNKIRWSNNSQTFDEFLNNIKKFIKN